MNSLNFNETLQKSTLTPRVTPPDQLPVFRRRLKKPKKNPIQKLEEIKRKDQLLDQVVALRNDIISKKEVVIGLQRQMNS